MEIREYRSVRKWFRRGSYKKRTERLYVKYMGIFCQALEKTPDELVSDIKTAWFPIHEMENVHKKLAKYMINVKRMTVRSIEE